MLKRHILSALLLVLIARPARANFSLAITTTGPNSPLAVVTSSPTGITCPSTCTASFVAGTTVTLTAAFPSTMTFVGWTGAQGCRTGRRTCNVLMSAAAAVTANFDPLLSLTISGTGIGSVSIPGRSTFTNVTNPGPRTFVFSKGSTIVLRASSGTASAFTGWTGDSGCSRASTCTITLNGYESITATFTATGSTRPLAVTIPMGGGTVTSSPAGISCPGTCTASFTAGATVAFTTAATSGYRFVGWANGGCSGLTACVVTSSSPLQGLGGRYSPAAFFYPTP